MRPRGTPVEVWHVPLDQPATVRARLEAVLDERERERAAGFRRDRDRDRWTVAHAALRQVLGCRLGAAPERLRFDSVATGKPVLAGGGLHFNLSHSEGRAVVAVAGDRPVGV